MLPHIRNSLPLNETKTVITSAFNYSLRHASSPPATKPEEVVALLSQCPTLQTTFQENFSNIQTFNHIEAHLNSLKTNEQLDFLHAYRKNTLGLNIGFLDDKSLEPNTFINAPADTDIIASADGGLTPDRLKGHLAVQYNLEEIESHAYFIFTSHPNARVCDVNLQTTAAGERLAFLPGPYVGGAKQQYIATQIIPYGSDRNNFRIFNQLEMRELYAFHKFFDLPISKSGKTEVLVENNSGGEKFKIFTLRPTTVQNDGLLLDSLYRALRIKQYGGGTESYNQALNFKKQFNLTQPQIDYNSKQLVKIANKINTNGVGTSYQQRALKNSNSFFTSNQREGYIANSFKNPEIYYGSAAEIFINDPIKKTTIITNPFDGGSHLDF